MSIGLRRPTALLALPLAVALTATGCVKDPPRGSAASASSDRGGCELAETPPPAAPVTVTATAAAEIPESARHLRPAIAYDIGGRGDAAFNDASVAGLDRAIKEMGIDRAATAERTLAAGESDDAKSARLRELAASGHNPVIAIGFAYAGAIADVAPQFPDTKFAIVDEVVDGIPNVTSLVFQEEQASFLMGVIAAYKTTQCHIGFIGGVETPLIQKFEAGYVQGAQAAAPDIQIDRKYLSPAGDASGFQDPAKANEAARGMIAAGADVLFHAAGLSGRGMFEATFDGGALALGVDSDQYLQVAEPVREVIISSMLKRADIAVYDFILAVAGGTTDRLPERFDLQSGAIGYSTTGNKITAITGAVEAYKAAIINGDIPVSDRP